MAYLIAAEIREILQDVGIVVPPNCASVDILMPANGEMRLRYEIVIENDDLPKLARAFALMGQSRNAE